MQDSNSPLAKIPPQATLTQNKLAPKKLIVQTIFGLILLVALLTLLSSYFKPEMEAWSRSFISNTGAWGVGLGFFIPDAFTLPIPPDTFLVAGHLGGLDFWLILIWASIGSILGGCFGFLMIRHFTTYPKIKKWLAPKIQRGEEFMQEYGLWALAVAALTPLPYSMICWACGAMGIRFMPFVAVSLLRIPRVAIYLLLIENTMHFVP
jgi:membrane protein YqaA with SNARE-associated domain